MEQKPTLSLLFQFSPLTTSHFLLNALLCGCCINNWILNYLILTRTWGSLRLVVPGAGDPDSFSLEPESPAGHLEFESGVQTPSLLKCPLISWCSFLSPGSSELSPLSSLTPRGLWSGTWNPNRNSGWASTQLRLPLAGMPSRGDPPGTTQSRVTPWGTQRSRTH